MDKDKGRRDAHWAVEAKGEYILGFVMWHLLWSRSKSS